MNQRGNNRLSIAMMLGILAVLAAANLALYFPVFQMEYYSDDFAIIPIAQGAFGEMFTLPDNPQSPMPGIYYRPVPMVTFWAINALGIESPAVNYGFNLLLNILNGFLVVLLILQCLPADTRPWQRRVAVLAGLAASLGFIASYSVVWVSQRFDLMAALFVLLAMYLAVRYWRGGNMWTLAGVCIAALLGMLSKETAFILPVLLPAWYVQERLLRRSAQPALGRMVITASASGLAAITAFAIRIAADVQIAEGVIAANLLRMPYGYIKSAIELLSPVRLGSVYGAYTEGYLMQVAVIAVIACVMSLPALYLYWYGFRRYGWKALLGVLLPAFVAVTLFGLRGYEYPRLLYLAVFVFWASFGCMLTTGGQPIRKAVIVALGALLVLQSAASWVITDYYRHFSGHIHRQLVPAATQLEGNGAQVIVQLHSRLLFRHHGSEVLAPLPSWEDPVYEWLFYSPSRPALRAQWRSPQVLEITEPLPNRFLHMAEGAFGITTLYNPGDTIAMPGYRVIVERTAMIQKVKSVRVEFDTARVQPPLYIDDEVQWRKLR